jgi:hypothetical protein
MKVQNKGAITGLSCSPDGVQIMAAGGDCPNAGVEETAFRMLCIFADVANMLAAGDDVVADAVHGGVCFYFNIKNGGGLLKHGL